MKKKTWIAKPINSKHSSWGVFILPEYYSAFDGSAPGVDAKANALKAAAAQEMFEALKMAHDAIATLHLQFPPIKENGPLTLARVAAKAAILKARGEV